MTQTRRRLWFRLTTALTAFAISGIVTVATAQPALAACVTRTAHVYATQMNGVSNFAVRFETDPLNGPVVNFTNVPFRSDALLVLRVGGNGLAPSSFPTWSVVRSDGTPGSTATAGSQTGSNCVSNEKTIQAVGMQKGFTFFIRASYNGGTSGQRIENQVIFSVTFAP